MNEGRDGVLKTASPEVVAAIDTLMTSLRYDPAERWLPAYNTLAKLRADLRRARRPFVAAQLLLGVLLFSAFYYGYWAMISNGFDPWWLFMAMFTLVFALSHLAGFIIRAWATRRHPLLKLQSEIEEACKYFDDAARTLATEASTQ